MKGKVLTLILSILSLGCEMPISIDKNIDSIEINGLRIGSPKNEIITTFGRPTSVETKPGELLGGTVEYLHYKDTYFIIQENKLVSFYIADDRFMINNKYKVGQKYKCNTRSSINEQDKEILHCTVPIKDCDYCYLDFNTKSDTIVSMELFLDL